MTSQTIPTSQGVKRKHCDDDESSNSSLSTRKEIPFFIDCAICQETKSNLEWNFPMVDRCEHVHDPVCRGCVMAYIPIKIRNDPGKGWAACECPQCGAKLRESLAKTLLSDSERERLNGVIEAARAPRVVPRWLRCQAPGCGHHEENPAPKNKRFPDKGECSECGTQMCLHHQSLWHEGETCLEHGIKHATSEEEEQTLLEVQRLSKACPRCRWRIEKIEGCNAMNCGRCHSNLFWDGVNFDGDDEATTARTRDGELGHAALEGEARESVQDVMDFENGELNLVEGTDDPFDTLFEDPEDSTQAVEVTPSWLMGLGDVLETFGNDYYRGAVIRTRDVVNMIDQHLDNPGREE